MSCQFKGVKRPREEVAERVYPLDALPRSNWPYEGAEVRPVPPYSTPTDVVAETTPPFACSGPLREPTVRVEEKVEAPENVLEFVNVFAVYVLGIVVDAWMYALTRESA